jgi:hypothetical protein
MPAGGIEVRASEDRSTEQQQQQIQSQRAPEEVGGPRSTTNESDYNRFRLVVLRGPPAFSPVFLCD